MPGEEIQWWPRRALVFFQSFFATPLDWRLPRCPDKLAVKRPSHRTILQHLPERQYLAQTAPDEVADVPLPSFDPGIFDNELMKLKLYPTIDPRDPSVIHEPEGNIVEGTYQGTQVALTQAYARIEQM